LRSSLILIEPEASRILHETGHAGGTLAVKGTDTTEQDAAVVYDLVGTVPRGRLLELPGGHASHTENTDRFLEELDTHIAVRKVR
jgi:hypothetical protein